MLDRRKAQDFLRAHFDMDVPDDDPLIVMYMLAQLGLDHLEPRIEEIAGKAGTSSATAAVKEVAEAQTVLADTAQRIAGLKDGMIATLEAAERLKSLNDVLDAKMAALDEKIAQLDIKADAISKSGQRIEQAVTALAAGVKSRKGLLR